MRNKGIGTYAPLEVTTLEDIGFDGDILHCDGDTCHALCNDAAHVGSSKTHWPVYYDWSLGTLTSAEEEELAAKRSLRKREQRIQREKDEQNHTQIVFDYQARYRQDPDPQNVTGLIKNRESFRKYLARTMKNPPEPWTEEFRDMWIWFNKRDFGGISPNEMLLHAAQGSVAA